MRFNFGLSARITFGAMLLLVAGGLLWIDSEHNHQRESYMGERSADLEAALHVEQARLAQSLERLRQDTLFLANTPPVGGMVRADVNGGIDSRDKTAYAAWESRLQEIFAAFLRTHPDYYQLRFIGAAGEGQELVRVESREGAVQVAPRETLQAKGDQAYFRAGLMLTVGRVHLSEFKLNQEWGKIEEPHRPTINAVTTVFDASGRVFGMVVVNKDVRPLFNSSMAGLPRGVQGYIADQRGHFMYHPDDRHAFSFESGSNENIVDDFPSLKPLFESQTSRNELPFHDVSGGVGGYLAAERVFFDVSDPSRFLLLAYHLPSKVADRQASAAAWLSIFNIVAFMLLVGAVFLLLLRRAFSPLKRITASAREIAAGNRDIRLREKDGGEIGELTEALNTMLNTLTDSDEIKQESLFLKELIESLPGIFYMIDAQGRFMMWNRNIEQVLQQTSEEMAASHPLDFFEGEGRSKIESAIRQVFETGEAGVEAELISKNGNRAIYRFTGRRIRHGGQSVLVGLGMDISEQKRAEELLRVAAATFETHDAILITDANANIIRVNRSFSDVTGYTQEEVIGKNPRIMSSGRQGKAFYQAMWKQIIESGSWTGEIWDRRKSGEIYPKWMTISAVKNERGETTQYVAIFSDITARKREEELIRSMAFYDALTQLPNRCLFLERFQTALTASERYNDYGAILFIDLDRFKILNDTLGHEYGDLLLVELAVRIKSCVREVDTVARLGGDEFVVLLESISSERGEAAYNAGRVAEKIREALARPYQLNDHEHSSSPSIGIKLFHGGGMAMDMLLKQADAAMYQSKEGGGNAIRFSDADLQREWDSGTLDQAWDISE